MKQALLATALGLSAMAAHAVPTTIVIDDFSSGAQALSFAATAAVGDSLSDTNAIRTLQTTLTQRLPPVGARAEVLPSLSLLNIANDTGENSRVNVSWMIAPGLIPADAVNVMFTVLVKESDANPTQLDLSFAGAPVGSYALPGNLINEQRAFSLSGVSFANGGLMTLAISGTQGWDLVVDTLGVSYDVPAVPEPASVTLMVLGVAGLLAARRRRRS